MDMDWGFRKTPSIAIIGGGFGGMCAAIQLQKQLGISSYTIFDENNDFGGTWLVNKYPGCACDVQSHLYCFSFEPNPDWGKNYSSQSEIHAYIVRTAKKHGLYKRVRFSTQVKNLEWNEMDGNWSVTVFDKVYNSTETLHYEFVFNAVGSLRLLLTPPEFNAFTGPVIHSAEWNSGIDLTQKIVGVVGSGASAVQIIPAIAPTVKELHSFQRSPAWIYPRPQLEFPAVAKKLFEILPFLMWIFRCLIFMVNEVCISAFKSDTLVNYLGGEICKFHMRRQLSDPGLISSLTPDYTFGCKRIIVSEIYFPTFNLSHVHLHRERIESVNGQTITTVDGVSRKIDVLILATGFRAQDFFAPLRITGREKVDLMKEWRLNGPRTYYGIMSNALPNAFLLLGPNTVKAISIVEQLGDEDEEEHSGLGHTSVLFMIECQVNFALTVIHESIKRRAKAVTVSKAAQDKWMKDISSDMEKTIWKANGGCGSWYEDGKGNITSLWPKTCVSYYRETRRVDFKVMEFAF